MFYRSVLFDPTVLSKQSSAGRGTVFLDRNGRELRFLPDDRARWIALAEIPDSVRNAYRGRGRTILPASRIRWHCNPEGVLVQRDVKNIPISKPEDSPVVPVPQNGSGHYTIGASVEGSAASNRMSGDQEIRILYPLDKDRFVLDHSGRVQTIKLQAAVMRPVAYVEWFVNGVSFPRTGPPYQTFWPQERGTFKLTAVTSENVGDAVQVMVE